MSSYNIVTNSKGIRAFRTSKYFVVNLGMSVTMFDKQGERVISDKDHFAVSYNYQYKTTIYAQGNIGGLKFYTDHGIHNDNTKIAIYYDLEEFIFDYDEKKIIENGIDSYIGYLLKSVDTMYEERMNLNKVKEEEKEKSVGVPEKLTMNPGNVNYDDIKEYLKNKGLK